MLYVVFILALAGFIALAVWGLDKYSALGCISSIVGFHRHRYLWNRNGIFYYCGYQ